MATVLPENITGVYICLFFGAAQITQLQRNYYCVAAWCLLRFVARARGPFLPATPRGLIGPVSGPPTYPAFALMQFYRIRRSHRNQAH